MESNAVIVAVLAFLALPGVSSFATNLIRGMSDSLNVNPRAIVYVVSVALTGVALLAAGGGDALPAFDGNPVALVSAWIAWATVNARAAEAVYDILAARLTPA